LSDSLKLSDNHRLLIRYTIPTLEAPPTDQPQESRPGYIRTARLLLRPIEDADAPALFALQTHPDVARYQDGRKRYELQDAIDFIPTIQSGIRNNRWHYWAIALRDAPDALIGNISLWHIVPEDHVAELGFELLPAYHRQGLMLEAAQATLQYAQAQLGIIRFEAYTRARNRASIGLLRRLGFAFDSCVDEEISPRHEEGGEVVLYTY
jgi:ribosomal-protein-alanine N-acetyltransferase